SNDPLWDAEIDSAKELREMCMAVAAKHQCMCRPKKGKRHSISRATKRLILEKKEIGMKLFKERGGSPELRTQWREASKKVRAVCRREMQSRWVAWRRAVAEDFRRGDSRAVWKLAKGGYKSKTEHSMKP
ncbi:MAG: uncharacterized protein A8A55_3621, partial [Amphiamblys sp. WSBS2006]